MAKHEIPEMAYILVAASEARLHVVITSTGDDFPGLGSPFTLVPLARR